MNRIVASLLSLGLASCYNPLVTKDLRYQDDVYIQIGLTKAEHFKSPMEEIAIFGRLDIKGISGELESADLGCIQIIVNGVHSKKLYVDSVAHVMTEDYKASSGNINVDVYWLFDPKVNIDNISSSDSVLIEEPRGIGCFN